jgi:hypothetical protein
MLRFLDTLSHKDQELKVEKRDKHSVGAALY